MRSGLAIGLAVVPREHLRPLLAVTIVLGLLLWVATQGFGLILTGAATDPWGNDRVGFEGKVKINRKDWGVNWNAVLEAGGLLVSEKVTLEFDISAVRRAS